MGINYTIDLNNKYFPLPLIVSFIDGHMWELMGTFEYHRDNLEVIRVPIGFKFDFASIPRPFWSWIGSPTGEYGPAAVIHDYLCETATWSISKTDYIFYEAMGILDVPQWKRLTMYCAVRLFHLFKK
jgi:hypothetical protein